MKKTLFLILVAITAISCKNKQEKLKSDMLPIISNVVKEDSIAYKIDSLIIYKIDTLTDLELESRKMEGIKSSINLFQTLEDSYLSTAKIKMAQAKSEISQMEISRDILESSALANADRQSALNYNNDAKDDVMKSKLYGDSAGVYINLLQNFIKRRQQKKIDSISFRGYIARFRLVGADVKNNLVKKDSLYIFFSPNLRIIK